MSSSACPAGIPRNLAGELSTAGLGFVDDLEHRTRLDMHESADGHLVPLGRVAKVHRPRSAQWGEGLILDALGVARPDGVAGWWQIGSHVCAAARRAR